MKILSFSYCFPSHAAPTWGVFVEQRLAALARHVELQVVSPVPWFPVVSRMRGPSGPATESWHGLTVHRPKFLCIPKVLKSLDGRLYARSLRRWLGNLVERSQPDLLDAHFVWPDGVGVSLLAKQLGIPYAITLRGKLYPCLEVPSQHRQCADALRDAAVVISVDSRMAQVARDLGVAADRIRVIPNGVDLEHFRPGDKVAARQALNLNLPQDARLLVTVAHLGRRKGHYETIEALSQLPNDVHLMLVGGTDSRGGDGEDLRKYAQAKGVANRLILAGKQPHHRIPLYYQAADACVLASWREGCPNTVLESLACGTPVVATDVGSVRWMISDGSNGRVVPLHDVPQLSHAIQEVLDQRLEPGQVRNSGAVRSWAAVADDVLEAFASVLPGSPVLPPLRPLSGPGGYPKPELRS